MCGQSQISQVKQKWGQFKGKNAGHVVPKALNSSERSRCLRCCSVVTETNSCKIQRVFLDQDLFFPSILHEQKSCLPLSVLLIQVQTQLRDLQEKWEGSGWFLIPWEQQLVKLKMFYLQQFPSEFTARTFSWWLQQLCCVWEFFPLSRALLHSHNSMYSSIPRSILFKTPQPEGTTQDCASPSSCHFQKAFNKFRNQYWGGIWVFPLIHKPFQERGRGGWGRDDDVLPGKVVDIFSISCSPHADFIPKVLISFDTVNDHGEAKTGIFGKLVSLRSSGRHF